MIYLYVKTHNKTGLKYLGKTVSKDPHKYTGSGKVWKRHLQKHGFDYTTEILLATEDREELIQTGLFFSNLWNIVKSDQWANLMEENGGGFTSESAKRVDRSHMFGGKIQRETMLRRISDGNAPMYLRTENKKRAQQNRVSNKSHNLLGNVMVIDKEGRLHCIPKEVYWSQSGPPEEWEFVMTTSKIARTRKSATL
jgi:hypothetical protein